MLIESRSAARFFIAVLIGLLAVLALGDGPPTEVWTHVHDSGVGNDIGYAVAIDSEGSVITAGYVAEELSGSTDLGQNGYLQKRRYDDTVAWTTTLDNPATDGVDSKSGDQFLAVCVDPDDNVIAGGSISGNYYGADGYWQTAIVQKYDAAGTLLWQWRGNNSYGAWASVRGIDVDPQGNVYACGSTFTSWGPIQHQWAIWKFSPDGQLQAGYPIHHNESTQHQIPDYAYGIDVHSDGAFVVAGVIGVSVGDGTTNKNLDWHVRRYHADGSLAWHDTFAGAAGLYDYAFGVTLDEQGHAFVAGYTNVGTDNVDGADYDGLVIKYSPTGVRMWTATDTGPAGEMRMLRDIAIDEYGDLTTVGYHRVPGADTYGGLSQARDSADGSVYGESVEGADVNTLSLSVAARGDLVAVTGYFGESGSHDLFTGLAEYVESNTPPIVEEDPRALVDLAAIGEDVRFDITAHDPDEDPVTVTWDFGDGTFATGDAPTHAFATPGLHLVTVTVSDGLDDVHRDLGVMVGETLVTPAVKARLNFKKPGKDSVAMKCSLALPADLELEGQMVYVRIGGVEQNFVLSRKGKAKTDTGTARLSYKKKSGLWKLTVKLKKGDFGPEWQDEGLVNETVRKVPIQIKSIVIVESVRCAHMVDALYTAKAGKWGRTK